jgi:hypothetical protein
MQENYLRAMNCFLEPIMMVDTSQPGWALLHVNGAFEQRLRISRDEAMGTPFWDLFETMQTCEVCFCAPRAAKYAIRCIA